MALNAFKRFTSKHLVVLTFLIAIGSYLVGFGALEREQTNRIADVRREAAARQLSANLVCRQLITNSRDAWIGLFRDFVKDPVAVNALVARFTEDFNPEKCDIPTG